MSYNTEFFQTKRREGYDRRFTNYRKDQIQERSYHYQNFMPEDGANSVDLQHVSADDINLNRPGRSQTYTKQFPGRFTPRNQHNNYKAQNSEEWEEVEGTGEDRLASANSDVANSSKMGEIVGGRYIRKHPNHSSLNSSRAKNEKTERNSYKHSQDNRRNFSHSNNTSPREQDFSNDYEKDYFCQKSSASSNSSVNSSKVRNEKPERNTYKHYPQDRRNFSHCNSTIPVGQQNLSGDYEKDYFSQKSLAPSNSLEVDEFKNKNSTLERKPDTQYSQNRKYCAIKRNTEFEANSNSDQGNKTSSNAEKTVLGDSQSVMSDRTYKQHPQKYRYNYNQRNNSSEQNVSYSQRRDHFKDSIAPQNTFRYNDHQIEKNYSESNTNNFSQNKNQVSSEVQRRNDTSTRLPQSSKTDAPNETSSYNYKHLQSSNGKYPNDSSLTAERVSKDNFSKDSYKSYSSRNNYNDDRKFSNSYSNFTKYRSQYQSDSRKSLALQQVSSNCISHAQNATQRELLIHHLNKGECECLVCCEFMRTKDQVWHCLSCFHVFHLRCIKKWARSPAAAVEDGSWRCPACQSLTSKVPFDYYCFCGKKKNPEVNYHLTPHTCGENCNRVRSDCSHHCKELCHPGPCPPCMVVVTKTCPCGKTSQSLPCNQTMEGNCQEICDRLLNCGLHRCKGICHEGPCDACEETVLQRCYCQKNEQTVPCTSETSSCQVYSCNEPCQKNLSCLNHNCETVCHPGDCEPCQRSMEVVKRCPCGRSSQTELIMSGKAKKRLSCLDPISVCGQVCEKVLHCGSKDNPHTCQSLCHEGECPPCPSTTSMKCTCGAFTKDFPCAEITKSFVYTCEKRCNKRKDCGRHKCLNHCCTNFEHHCELVCNKKLSCGQHQCQETCHMGNCPTCWNVSFDELRCHCGEMVLYPPIHCATKPPECSKPCIRSHPCEHDVKHTCHSDAKCPPCTALTTKLCYGKHKQCNPVMCFLDGVSCGMPCQKPLPCSRHKCKQSCHGEACLKDGEKCTQPCTTPRSGCGHPCGLPCHEGECPESNCKTQVTLNCPCGHRSETSTCYESAKSYRLLSSTILATKMQEIKDGQSVNLNDVLGKRSKNNKLQCNEECAVIERNKRLAVALQIQNPDLSCSPGPPAYSEFLKDEAKKSPIFVSDVYEKLMNLVHLAKESKQKCRSHSFPPMNRDQRRVVHELAEFFGCETQSYDEEPKKNVVVTAYKSKCWLPFTSIMSIVQRDMGIRKGPAPLLPQTKNSAATTAATNTAPVPKKKIDYFDYTESN